MRESRDLAVRVRAEQRPAPARDRCRTRRPVLLEDDVHFLDRDLVGERRQLVENLPRLQARVAVERLREEQHAHRRGHLVERLAQFFLIGGRSSDMGRL